MIYCVEDDSAVREIELYTLRATGFEAMGFSCGTELFEALKERLPRLIILDVMLPGEDGVTILRRLKALPETSSLPIIMATAKGQEYDKIQSLDLGADDYLVKPFGMMEMVSRVRAVLRRVEPKNDGLVRLGGLCLDEKKHRVTADGQQVELTLKEYELLRLLLSQAGTVFTRDKLLNSIWGFDYDGETRTVDVHIRTLRAKLGECGELIETVRGVGYRMGEKA